MTTANIAICNVIDSTPDYGYITVYYNRKVFNHFIILIMISILKDSKTKAYALVDRIYDQFPSKTTLKICASRYNITLIT